MFDCVKRRPRHEIRVLYFPSESLEQMNETNSSHFLELQYSNMTCLKCSVEMLSIVPSSLIRMRNVRRVSSSFIFSLSLLMIDSTINEFLVSREKLMKSSRVDMFSKCVQMKLISSDISFKLNSNVSFD